MARVRGIRGDCLTPRLPDQVCRAHLQKVASSMAFARAEQLRRLLEWLGQRSLTPDLPPPTEKEIAETVLHRADFDPQTDSLVRKEVSRLREKLMLYYANEGARDRVRIRHLSGYLLHFTWSEGHADPAGERYGPCVLILPLRSPLEANQQAIRVAEELIVLVGEAGGPKLVSPTTAMSYAGRIGDIREFAAECGSDYVVEGSLDVTEAQFRLTLWFVNGRSGTTEQAGRFAAADPDAVAGLGAAWIREQINLEGKRANKTP
jgi:TolB-like protein